MRARLLIIASCLLTPLPALAQTTLPPARTNPSPSDPSIGTPADPSSMSNPAARATPSMPAETGGGTVPGSGGGASSPGGTSTKP